eukprot:scaffold22137_cov164-Amphora_coffeaeformis.AAC.2
MNPIQACGVLIAGPHPSRDDVDRVFDSETNTQNKRHVGKAGKVHPSQDTDANDSSQCHKHCTGNQGSADKGTLENLGDRIVSFECQESEQEEP